MPSPPAACAHQHQIRIGCSGWNYRHWRGAFYPDKLPIKRWFEYYAEHFDTVEINNSFYRLPPAETFDKWRDQAPAGFAYAVKANRYLTQAKKLKDCAEPVARMMAPVRHLGATLGPILYQLPPTLQLNLARLEAFLTLLPDDLVHVFEFRHPSWYVPETRAMLARHGASFCCHDMAGLASPRWATGHVAYVRFHGTGENIGAATTATVFRIGHGGWSSRQRKGALSGPISTTTSSPTPSPTQKNSSG